MEALKQFLESVLQNPVVVEFLIRVFGVFIVAEGFRIALKMLLELMMKSQAKLDKWVNALSVFANLGFGAYWSVLYAAAQSPSQMVEGAILYGFGSIALHMVWVKFVFPFAKKKFKLGK